MRKRTTVVIFDAHSGAFRGLISNLSPARTDQTLSANPLVSDVAFGERLKQTYINFARIQLLPCSTATTSASIIKMIVSASS